MFNILVVEDDKELNRSLCSFLNSNGYEATAALSVKCALSAIESKIFDLIISDIMMPETDGLDFAKAIRLTDKEIPIIFVTARDDFITKKISFEAGIDDYMVKPIDPEELLLRISAIMRRARINSSKCITAGSLVMDINERSAKLNGKEIPLTAREFNIIYKLLSYPGQAFTRSQLMDEFWESETSSSPRTVDVYMAKLRDKFEHCKDFEIVTIHGLGYKAVLK